VSDSSLVDDGTAFAALLGGFGTHANTQKRAKAERMAALKKNDGRRQRKVTRPHQFNVRVDDDTKRLTQALIDKFNADGRDGNSKWSQADMVIAAIAALAKAEKVRGGE
jgi:hypothetical protein